jgi:hypothetical protein
VSASQQAATAAHWWTERRDGIAARAESEFRARHRTWAARIANKLPGSLQSRILAGWDDRYGIRLDAKNGSPVARANQFASASVRDFGDARAGLAYDESAITTHAENYAGKCARMKSRERRARFVNWFGITPPEGKRITDAGACARMDDALWWRRQLRKVWTRRSEDAMRRAGVIRKGRAPYASDEAVRHRAARQRRTREWMEARVMVNGEGEQLELLALAEKSIANPALRRGEFMCRMRGFEEIATDLGHVALFFTLTAPSAFHAQLSSGGANPAHKRETVRDAQAWLCKVWSRARAKLARLSILFYGFRVAEPHHDATPHWHMVLFLSPQHADTMRSVLAGVWLSEFRDEPGAAEHRCKCVVIDPGKGSAAGYVAKYVSKNIDAAGSIGDEISDETGAQVVDSVVRVAAWASCHGIRQFQQLGGPPVGLWRECRRVRDAVDQSSIERARAAADAGNWAHFIDALGGIGRAPRRVRCVSEKYARQVVRPSVRVRRLAKKQWRDRCGPRVAWHRREALPAEMPAAWVDRGAPRTTDPQGREVLAPTRYGEPPADRACGVVAFGLLGRWASMRTRRHRWRIERRGGPGKCASGRLATDAQSGAHRAGQVRSFSESFSHLGPVAITVRKSDFRPDPAFAWIATVPYRNTGPP